MSRDRFAVNAMLFFSLCLGIPVMPVAAEDIVLKNSWDSSVFWETGTDGKSTISLKTVPSKYGNGLEISYDLKNQDYGWAEIRTATIGKPAANIPLVFLLKANSPSYLEIKFIDTRGSTFLKKIDLKGKYSDWTQIVVYSSNLDFGWGPANKFSGLKGVSLAISGKGNGTVWLDEIGLGTPGLAPSFVTAGPLLDPERMKDGIGFTQRRSKELTPEDPLVLEWLKQMQDSASPAKQLLPSMEDNIAQTFNNSLSAMAFILKNEKERAERILDYYSAAVVKDNQDIALQNFFYKGEPRGFYQNVVLSSSSTMPSYQRAPESDRWIGDMAWLLMAYKYYEKTYKSKKYEYVVTQIKELFISFYQQDSIGGYIQHGWRKGDLRLHEQGDGHPEGNIDCYAALRLCGETKYENEVRKWLDNTLKDKENLPLDLYTWRTLAYGKKYSRLLEIPDFDLRYRKIMEINGKKVMGFYHGPDGDIKNIWIDGLGHMACAYFAAGNEERGNFYANQMDAFLIDRNINGVHVRALPYTVNKDGGYDWVDVNKGATSAAAWYIFAKNHFNPFTLETERSGNNNKK